MIVVILDRSGNGEDAILDIEDLIIKKSFIDYGNQYEVGKLWGISRDFKELVNSDRSITNYQKIITFVFDGLGNTYD